MKNLTRILSFILILTICIIPTLLTSFASVKLEYDYSRDGSYFNTEKNTADLVEIITGEELSDAEYAYLEEYGELRVKYEEITSQHVKVSVSDESIIVTAGEHSYVGKEGGAALWTPKRASVGGIFADFTKNGDTYTATFEGVTADEDTVVGVEYELTVNGGGFVFAKESVNNALNLAYNNKSEIKSIYDAAVAKEEAYNAYYSENKAEVDTYYQNLESYRQYLLDKKLYDAKLSVYNEYLSELEKYESDKIAYDEYVIKKNAYDAVVLENAYIKQAYDEEYKYYKDNYLNKINLAKEQIKTLDDALMKKVTALERQLYSSIFASLVDQVVENKDLFVSVLGADPEVIDACGTATGILRSILGEYHKLKTEKDKYEFYIQNYVTLRDNVILLTRALENLYQKRSIRTTMHDQGKTEKFVIFVAQLVLFANTLTDEAIYDYTGSYRLDKNTTMRYLVGEGSTTYTTKTMLAILENNEYIKDTGNAKPLTSGYPAYVEEPKEPEYKPLPAKPDDMQEPIEPEEVDNPGSAPTVVNEPTEPTELKQKKLTDQDISVINNTVYKNLVSAYDLIVEREEINSDFEYKPTKTVAKNAISQNSVEVTFMDYYGEKITSVTVEKNDSVSFMGDIPTQPSDIVADYEFDYWYATDKNTPYALNSVDSDVVLYPHFNPIYKNYDTAYNVGGNNYLHVDISGEDLDVAPLDRFISVASANSTGILFTADNVVLRITSADVLKLRDAGVTILDTDMDTSNPSAYTCRFSFKNSENAEVDTSATIQVQISCSDSAFATTSILSYTDTDGSEKGTNKTYSAGFVSFKAKSNLSYLMCVRRTVSAMMGSGVTFVGSSNKIIPGETVTIVPVDAPAGKRVQYTYTANGNTVVIDGNSFVMPNYDVSVGVTYIDIRYTVTFISDGNVISSNDRYTYGQKLEKPRDPVKQNDDNYSYTFIGWSPEISDTVTGDATYVAQYARTLLVKEEKKGPQIQEKYLKLIRLALVAVSAFVVMVAGGITLIIVLRRRKRRMTENPDPTPPTDTPPTETEETETETTEPTPELPEAEPTEPAPELPEAEAELTEPAPELPEAEAEPTEPTPDTANTKTNVEAPADEAKTEEGERVNFEKEEKDGN